MGPRKKWLYLVGSKTWREILRSRVGSPKEATEVRWAYMLPGIHVPIGLADTTKGCWTRVKLVSIPGQDTKFDIFFIEQTFYEMLKIEQVELGDREYPVDPPARLHLQSYASPDKLVSGCRGKTTHGLTFAGSNSHGVRPRDGHHGSDSDGRIRSESYHH